MFGIRTGQLSDTVCDVIMVTVLVELNVVISRLSHCLTWGILSDLSGEPAPDCVTNPSEITLCVVFIRATIQARQLDDRAT